MTQTTDDHFLHAVSQVVRNGISTSGRTATDRNRLLEGMTFRYDCRDGQMSAFTLRKNNPELAIAETLAFIMGAWTVGELVEAHPGLKLWDAWASDGGSLGGVYGEAFSKQYPEVIRGLLLDPNSTHHRMTTLIPDNFPVRGNSYDDNVRQNKFSLMPCLHSYHFLSDGETLHLHATQASGDLPVGVFPHNAYQVQFMLLLTAKLAKLKPGTVTHHVHDIHIYENQMSAVADMLYRKPLTADNRITLTFSDDLRLGALNYKYLKHIRSLVKSSKPVTHKPIKMEVDS